MEHDDIVEFIQEEIEMLELLCHAKPNHREQLDEGEPEPFTEDKYARYR